MKPQFPTVQEQIEYWNTKERLEHERVMALRAESRDATNETREADPIIVGGRTTCRKCGEDYSMADIHQCSPSDSIPLDIYLIIKKQRDTDARLLTDKARALIDSLPVVTNEDCRKARKELTKVLARLDASNPQANASTTAQPSTQKEGLTLDQIEATCDFYDEREANWNRNVRE